MTSGSGKWLLVGTALLLCVTSAEAVLAGDIAWRSVPRAAQQEAWQSGRPLLIYVGADFCGYCRKLEQTTWADEAVAGAIQGHFVPLRIDGQRDPELARRLGVRAFPAVLVLAPSGRLLGRADGYRAPAAMGAFLQQQAARTGGQVFAGR